MEQISSHDLPIRSTVSILGYFQSPAPNCTQSTVAGMQVISIACDNDGNIDIADFGEYYGKNIY
jgi:hypothetical protein